MFGLSKIASRIIAALVLLCLVAVVFQVRSCTEARRIAAQSKVDRGQAGAARESAKDAIGTITDVQSNQSASEDLTRSNEKDIRNAEGSADPVNAAARDAGLRALCSRAAYRDNERCRVFRSTPR